VDHQVAEQRAVRSEGAGVLVGGPEHHGTVGGLEGGADLGHQATLDLCGMAVLGGGRDDAVAGEGGTGEAQPVTVARCFLPARRR
jgi:hypothetical protein